MKTTLMLILLAAGSRMGYAACKDTSINWTMYLYYTDPTTGSLMNSAITGDGVQTDSGGNTVYADGGEVNARLNGCATLGSGDATMGVGKSRSFNVNVGISQDYEDGKQPPTTMFSKEGGLINVSDVMWCQRNGRPNGCTFYTRMTVNFTGPDGNDYRLRMENPSSVPVTEWAMDATGNCAYTTSQVQVVFTPAALSVSNKDTYVVTPVLQGTTGGAPATNGGCPASTFPYTATWPAALSVLVGDIPSNGYNYGQYDTPFQFVIQVQ